ncbi:MAG: hypothetical protein ACLQG3_01035 [Terracidiphilus sp.]
MRTHNLIASSGLFLFLASTASGMAQAPSEDLEIPFSQGFDVSFNGSAPIHFGIDTGLAWDFFLTSEQARQLALPVLGQHIVHTSDHKEVPGSASDIAQAKTLLLAGRTFTDRKGLAAPNSHRDDVGITLFSDLLITLDYPRDRMRLRTGSLPPANGKDIVPYTTQPDADFKVLQVSPMVTIKLADQSFPALIDTGAHTAYGDVIVPPEVAAKLPLSEQLGTVTIGDALGRKFPGVVRQLNGDLTIGSVVIHKPIVTVSEWLGFVNVGPATKRLALTIDQKNHLVQLTLPASESSNSKN